MKTDDTFRLVATLCNCMNDLILEELTNAGITGVVPSHGSILLALFKFEEGLSMNNLAEQIGKSPQTVTTLVKKLQEKGYVRTEKSTSDKRTTLVLLTQEGKALQPLFIGASEKLFATQYNKMGAQEIDEIRRLLGVMLGNFQEKQKGQS